jgi:hypothetical protein
MSDYSTDKSGAEGPTLWRFHRCILKNFAGADISMFVQVFPWLGTSVKGPVTMEDHWRLPDPFH